MTMGTLIFGTGMGLQATSRFSEARAAEAQAKVQSRMALYNQQVAEQDAKAIEAKSLFDQLRQLKRGQKQMGRLRARLGASGARMDEGASADILAEQAYENALENALIGYEGQVGASRRRSAGTLYGYQSDIYKRRAKSYSRAGTLGAASTLLTGFGTMGQEGMLDKTPFGSWWG